MNTDPEFNATAILETALVHHQAGRFAEAEQRYRQLLTVEPDNPDALHLLGLLRHQVGRHVEAIELIERAVRHTEPNEHFLNNLGQIYKAVGRYADAVTCYRKAIAVNARFAEAYNNLGNALSGLGAVDEAVAAYRQALAVQPDFVLAKYNLGSTLRGAGYLDEATALLREVVAAHHGHADAHNNLGLAFLDQGLVGDAVARFQNALAAQPNNADALNNLGCAFARLELPDQSVDFFERALALNPNHADALNNRAIHLKEAGRLEEALAGYRGVLKTDPNHAYAATNLLFSLGSACAWPEYTALARDIDRRTREAIAKEQTPPERPFHNIIRCADPELNYHVARLWSREITRRTRSASTGFSFSNRRGPRPRLTIGYLSRDFRYHAVGHLVHELFGLHDRGRFAIHAYSFGSDDGSSYRRRIENDCDLFLDVRALDDIETARRIHADGVDILIELTGFTQNNRLGIAALRPAPIQVTYLGFAGTIGGDFFDYIITDRTVTPEDHARFYAEKFVYMPDCYVVHGREPIATSPPTRAQAGLPDSAFVFCSFNQGHKITPEIFGVWMALLEEFPTSCLWLYKGNPLMIKNLRAAVAEHGVAPDRLIFGEPLPKDQHLARLRLADLALDTPIFNGGVTTSDALWAGLPVVTVTGSHCPSLGSASKLKAIGLPELIAGSLDRVSRPCRAARARQGHARSDPPQARRQPPDPPALRYPALRSPSGTRLPGHVGALRKRRIAPPDQRGRKRLTGALAVVRDLDQVAIRVAGVDVARGVNVGDGENHMVDTADGGGFHAFFSLGGPARRSSIFRPPRPREAQTA